MKKKRTINKRKKNRSSKQRRTHNRQRPPRSIQRFQRSSTKKRSSKKQRSTKKQRSMRKRQSGGIVPMVATAIGATAAAALAYAGFQIISHVKDKSITLSLIDSPMIDYLPKLKVVETKELLDIYLNSLTTIQLFTLLLQRQDLFRSQTILNLLKDVSVYQQDIRGQKRIHKLEALIDKLRSQNESLTIQDKLNEYRGVNEEEGGDKGDVKGVSEEGTEVAKEQIFPVDGSEAVADLPVNPIADVEKPTEPVILMTDVTSQNEKEPGSTLPEQPPLATEPALPEQPPLAPEPALPEQPPLAPEPALPEQPPLAPEQPPLPAGQPSSLATEQPSALAPEQPSALAPEQPSALAPEQPPLSEQPPLPEPSLGLGAESPAIQMGQGYDEDLPEHLQSTDLAKTMTVNPDILFSRNIQVKTLERHLLATSRFPGNHFEGTETIIDEGKSIDVTPFVTVRGVLWYEDAIIKGQYDEDFSNHVDALLDERGSLQLMNPDRKKSIQRTLDTLKDNEHFRTCILRKMRECCSKPRGYMDYIRGDISWDSNRKCLLCPDQECLIYIYNIYYSFLLEMTEGVGIIDKLYALIMVEARIAILSKCISLESIRIQDNQSDRVEYLLDMIYESDRKRNRLLPEPSEKYSQMFERVKRGQVGGGDPGVEPGDYNATSQFDLAPSGAEAGVGAAEAIAPSEVAPGSMVPLERQAYELGQEQSQAKALETEAQKDIALAKEAIASSEAEKQALIMSEAEKAEATQQASHFQELSEEAQAKEMAERQAYEKSQAIAEQEALDLNTLQAKYRELEESNRQMTGDLERAKQEGEKYKSEMEAFQGRTPQGVLRETLKNEMIAHIKDKDQLLAQAIMLLQSKSVTLERKDVESVVEEFMNVYFPTLQIALLDYRGNANPGPFLKLYADHYSLFQFMQPSLIASEVYGTHESDGYLDELMLTIFSQNVAKEDDYVKNITRMTAPIFLHGSILDDYPLKSLSERDFYLSHILQNMIPILKNNPAIFAKLLLAMKVHDRSRDSLLIGDLRLIKELSERYEELKGFYDDIRKEDRESSEDRMKGLSPGPNEASCQNKVDEIYDSLKKQYDRPIRLSDLLLLTKCQEQRSELY